MCPDISGLTANILASLNDDGTTYPSGKVQQVIFKSVNEINGYLGSQYSGTYDDGCISPPISGIQAGVFQLYVAKELTKGSLMKASRTFNLLSFREGDSAVTVSDSSKSLAELYKQLTAEFNEALRQAKYSLVSAAPSAVHGVDKDIPDNAPQPYPYPYPFPYR